MPIAINGDGTITGVSVGGMPDGIVDTDMLATDAVTAAKIGSLPAGSILQIVEASTSTLTTITSTTMTDSGLSGSITPSSSSSKILVIITQDYSTYRNDPFALGDVRVVRDSTVLKSHRLDSTCQNHSTYGNRVGAMFSFCYLDSPATTSSVTYKTQGSVPATANSANIRFNKGNLATITLLEVEA